MEANLKNICPQVLMSRLFEHYGRQITVNATVIVDTYESLDKIEAGRRREINNT